MKRLIDLVFLAAVGIILGGGTCGIDIRPVLTCEDNREQEACEKSSCVWDQKIEKCFSTSVFTYCESAANPDSCVALGCVWKPQGACVSSTFPTKCTNHGSQGTCEATEGCYWDSGAGCLSTWTSACNANTTEATCNQNGCSWGPVSKKCYGSFYPCFSFSSEDCPVTSGCRRQNDVCQSAS